MLSRLSTRSVKSQSSRPRFRPQVEGLEGREVPAAFTWLGGDPSDPGSWLSNEYRTPWEGDDLYFDGNVYGGSCDLSSWTGVAFKSMRLIENYSGTVTWIGGSVETLELRSGALATPDVAGLNTIDIYNSFTWTGGALNSTADHGLVSLHGATAAITPPADGSLVTGSSLLFAPDGKGAGSTGTFSPGTVQFNNGAGVVVEAYCRADVKPAQAKVVFDAVNPTGVSGRITIKAGGTVEVSPATGQTTGIWLSDLPIWNDGGTLKIMGTTTASFSAPPQTPGSPVYQSAGVTYIENGSTLQGASIAIVGGKLSTLARAQGEQTATINVDAEGNLLVDAEVVICDGSNPHVFGKLHVNGSVTWQGGTYRPVLDGSNPANADLWSCTGKFTNPHTAENLRFIAPRTVNIPPGGVAKNQKWRIVHSDVEIVPPPAGLPPVYAPVIGYQLIPSGNPNVTDWDLTSV
jgi:hypothetical protein